MPDGKWLIGCWEKYGKYKGVFGRPSPELVIECIEKFPRGVKPIFLQHFLTLKGYHPRCSLQQLVLMVGANQLAIDHKDQIYVKKAIPP